MTLSDPEKRALVRKFVEGHVYEMQDCYAESLFKKGLFDDNGRWTQRGFEEAEKQLVIAASLVTMMQYYAVHG